MENIMPNVWLTSDPHYGHSGVCKFMRNDGVTKLRPWDSVEEMDEELIKRHNERVKPNDKIYFLGDVVINRKHLKTLSRLNGDKILIRGNHDIFKDDEYRVYFRELRAYHIMNGLIFSHIPIHPDSLARFKKNVHGHLHSNRVLLPNGEIDVRYHCVCVEQTDFAPILFEDLLKRMKEEEDIGEFKNGNY